MPPPPESCRRRLNMCASHSRPDDRVTFRVERHRIDRCPVARLARPARRVLLPGLLVQRMARIENGVILATVALGAYPDCQAYPIRNKMAE